MSVVCKVFDTILTPITGSAHSSHVFLHDYYNTLSGYAEVIFVNNNNFQAIQGSRAVATHEFFKLKSLVVRSILTQYDQGSFTAFSTESSLYVQSQFCSLQH